ncbi:ABC-type transport auxiliary lipoprotein family protein [Dechloromonas sp.]|uniref:ABC-type transport auxiliary lipoprotein family protein n=1 Tax=Dechloromonas sp. TaxID=1917218 RepID=UPI00263F8759|nr:ABC-type transport auxiliary lipoprotein family protein [Dechloromonas sp.]
MLLILCCLFAISGCLTTGKRGGDTAIATYDFGAAPAVLVQVPRKLPLAVEVRAPLWFDTLGIDYRLAYAEPARLREYAMSRWAGPPALLIQQRMIQQLALSMPGQSRTVCVLRFDIREFSQWFTTPQQSIAVLQGRLLLLDRGRRQIAEKNVDIHLPVQQPNAQGGVLGLTSAVDRLIRQILAWEGEWQETETTHACRA